MDGIVVIERGASTALARACAVAGGVRCTGVATIACRSIEAGSSTSTPSVVHTMTTAAQASATRGEAVSK